MQENKPPVAPPLVRQSSPLLDASINSRAESVTSTTTALQRFDPKQAEAFIYKSISARGFVNGTGGGAQDGPYRQTYRHDAFGNLTVRNNRYWSQGDNYVASYNTSNRNLAWQYDAAGHIVQDETQTYTFDVAGRNVQAASATATVVAGNDGDGQMLKRTVNLHHPSPAADTTTINYFVRSSVLGGYIVTQLNSAGQKQTGYVYLGGEVLAEQGNADITSSPRVVGWRHENP